jgi:enterochelin esterase-like enzyme
MPPRRLPPGRFVALGAFQPPGAPARPVRAYLPSTVHRGTPHSLLILLDGQNVFGDHGSFAGGWHAHDAVDHLVAATLEAPIVVAVDNGGAHRLCELGRDVRLFGEALAHDLLPRLAATFALRGREGRVVGGASLGGLAALYAAFDHPEAFGAALAMSPSLWFGRRCLPRRLAHAEVTVPAGVRVYLDAGARERGRMFADAADLAAWLGRHGVPPERLLWRPDQRGAHHEKHWRRRLPKALRFLFRREALGPAAR